MYTIYIDSGDEFETFGLVRWSRLARIATNCSIRAVPYLGKLYLGKAIEANVIIVCPLIQ